MQLPYNRFRKSVRLLLFGLLLTGSSVHGVPTFIKESLYSPHAASVLSVESTLASDFVLLGGGLHQGIRRGVICRIFRQSRSIGELVIVQSNSNRSVGLILKLADDSSIQVGDMARIKTNLNS